MSTFGVDHVRELDDKLDQDILREHISDIDVGFSDAQWLAESSQPILLPANVRTKQTKATHERNSKQHDPLDQTHL